MNLGTFLGPGRGLAAGDGSIAKYVQTPLLTTSTYINVPPGTKRIEALLVGGGGGGTQGSAHDYDGNPEGEHPRIAYGYHTAGFGGAAIFLIPVTGPGQRLRVTIGAGGAAGVAGGTTSIHDDKDGQAWGEVGGGGASTGQGQMGGFGGTGGQHHNHWGYPWGPLSTGHIAGGIGGFRPNGNMIWNPFRPVTANTATKGFFEGFGFGGVGAAGPPVAPGSDFSNFKVWGRAGGHSSHIGLGGMFGSAIGPPTWKSGLGGGAGAGGYPGGDGAAIIRFYL